MGRSLPILPIFPVRPRRIIRPLPIRPRPLPYPIPFPLPVEYTILHKCPDQQEVEFMLNGILYDGHSGIPEFDFNYTVD